MNAFDDIAAELALPFPPERVRWRVGSTNAVSRAKAQKYDIPEKRATKGVALAYLTARDVMQRLDDVLGSDGWADDYEETPKRLLCRIGIKVSEDQWVWKSDAAGDTAVEGEKGGASDAFKRAAVKWGIGRYLYDCPAPWVDLENGKLPRNFDGRQYLPASAFSSKKQKTKYWKELRDAIAESDNLKAKQLWLEMDSEQQIELCRDYSSGQRSHLKELLE